MIGRRYFLLGGLGFIFVAGLGFFGGRLLGEGEIVGAIRRRLGFLHLDDDGLHAFARDQVDWVLAKRPSLAHVKYHLHMMFSKPAAGWGMSTDNRSRRARLEDHFVTLYLLSTDFLVNGADESRTVRYVALYDPLHPCGNPFARPPGTSDRVVGASATA